ncbi:MAG: HAD-IA family hydrolase [Candidatus Omnitrophica bacterium]|nr:HAD-IA family hydrolase [Candidatus Omnitrophota bacterium]
MIKLLIYDLDGTLIDSRLDIAYAVNWTLKELGRGPLPVEQVSSFVGNGVKNLMQQALKASSPSSLPPLERSIKLFRRRYGEHLLDQTRLYPSVKKVLEFFKDLNQAVVTNKPEDFTREILRGLGIDSYFGRVIGGDQGFPKKPAPEPVLELLGHFEVRPEETLLIGDSQTDVETARNAGVKTVAVTYGFGKRSELESAQPDILLNDLEELTRCPLLKK